MSYFFSIYSPVTVQFRLKVVLQSELWLNEQRYEIIDTFWITMENP